MSQPTNKPSLQLTDAQRAAVAENLGGIVAVHHGEWVAMVDALHAMVLLVNGVIARHAHTGEPNGEVLLLDLRTVEQAVLQLHQRAAGNEVGVRQLHDVLVAKAPASPGDLH